MDDARFQAEVAACVEALNEYLPQLATRHSSLALMTAMAEHVAGALQILLASGACSPEQARALLAQLRERISEPPPAVAADE